MARDGKTQAGAAGFLRRGREWLYWPCGIASPPGARALPEPDFGPGKMLRLN
jgi:hypothetical protein